MRFLTIILVRILGYKKHRSGRFIFWGGKVHIPDVKRALSQIAILDPKVHASITSKEKLIGWYHKRDAVEVANTFTIPEAFFAWGENGIIARIIYVHFLSQNVGLGTAIHPANTLPNLHRKTCRETLQWLLFHHFPDELCEAFRPGVFSSAE